MFNKFKDTTVYASIAWSLNVFVFLFASSYVQVLEIYKYSYGFISFIRSVAMYFYDFLFTIPIFTAFLACFFLLVLYYFWYMHFLVFFLNMGRGVKHKKTTAYTTLSTLLSFLGFGCIACGQTLLLPIILFFFSSSSLFLLQTVGNLSIVFGIVLLAFGAYRNYQIYKNGMICKI